MASTIQIRVDESSKNGNYRNADDVISDMREK